MINLTKIGKKQASYLEKAYLNQQLAHSYLFVDTDIDRATSTAFWLACLYNCEGTKKPCGKCQNCQQILSGNHPDVLLVKTENKQTLGIEQIRPLKEELAKSPVESSCRFFIIKEAQKLTLPAANALLNLLEEPVAPVVSILISNNADQILPTIRSRTQIINFDDELDTTNKQDRLLTNGFSLDEINELGDRTKLDQAIKYFYQEILENNDLAIVSAHKLAELSKSKTFDNYIIFSLKMLAEADLKEASNKNLTANLLACLLEIDKMRFSNVNLRNCLDYLVLEWRK